MFTKKLKFLQNAFFVSAALSMSTLFGFLVQLYLAMQFGASLDMDAYFASIVLTALFLRLLGMPLSFVFIPYYKELREKDTSTAHDLYTSVFWVLTGLFALIGIGMFAFSQTIAGLIIPGASAETLSLTADLLKVIAVYTFFTGTYFGTRTMHVSHDSYLIPYAANATSTLTVLIVTVLFVGQYGIFAAAYGLVAGSFLELVISFATIPQTVLRIPQSGKKHLIQFLKVFIPFGIASLIYRSTPLIDRYFASFLEQGNIAILGYGLKFLDSTVAFLSAGLAIVLLPITSKHSAKKQDKDLSDVFVWGMRAIGLLAIPTLMYVLFYSNTLIAALFQRGNFTPEVTQNVANVLIAYSGALIALSLGGQMTNIFYAKKKHMTVVLTNLLLLPLYIGLVAMLSKIYGATGIAVSYSAYTILTVAVYIALVQRLISIDWKHIFKSYLKFIVSAGLMIAVIAGVSMLIPLVSTHLLYVMIQVAAGGLSYFVFLWILRSTEVRKLVSFAAKKLRR